MKFAHLHLHSDFSLSDAILRIPEAARAAREMNQEALALTDHGSMAGLVKHYQACRKQAVLPILGMEAYLVPHAASHPQTVKEITDRVNAEGRKDGNRKHVTSVTAQSARLRRHLLLLARDFTGYQMLVKACSKSYRQGYYKPLLDHSDLEALAEGGHVWLSSGCFNAPVPYLLRNGDLEAAEFALKWHLEVFRDNLVIELQNHGFEEEPALNAQLVTFAKRYSIPLIATNDVHYLDPADRKAHDFFKALCYKQAGSEFGGEGGYHLCEGKHLQERLPEWWDDCLAGIEHVVASCRGLNFPPLDNYSYTVPQVTAKNPMAVLLEITRAKLDNIRKYNNNAKSQEYLERWQAELQVIRDTGFAHYFLFVRLIVKFCEDNDVFCLARGSASGSLICYLLGITQLDPVEHGLLFERFLSNDRTKPPDIDLDVEDNRRDEVLAHISRRFQTTQIGTMSTYADRSIKAEVTAQLQREGLIGPDVRPEQLAAAYPQGQRFLDRLTGVKRSAGGHPAGVVAETGKLSVAELVPLMKISSSERQVTQYDMDDVEALGFVKVDVLGVRAMRTARVALKLIGMDISDWDKIPDNDKKTFQLLSRGDTEGVFTFKGWSNRTGCKLLKPKNINDCSLIAALWRPSCLQLGLEQKFLERRRQRWTPPPEWHPVLAKALKPYYGVAVYQESVIEILKAIGFSADECMQVLKAVKKKDMALLAPARTRLVELLDRVTAAQVWELMEGYALYGFNYSHALEYATRGYRMAWIKANHPLAFICALLQTEGEKSDQEKYTREARKMGLRILSADIQLSGATWRIENGELRRGFSSVPGIGEKAAHALVEARPYASLAELRERAHPQRVNMGVLKKLANARALKRWQIDDETDLARELQTLEAA